MKMETTITAHTDGEVDRVILPEGRMVFADDLVVIMK